MCCYLNFIEPILTLINLIQLLNSKLIMNLLKQQTLNAVQQTYYQPFQMSVKSNSLFVPFLKERDSMGRLIKNQFTAQNINKIAENEPKNINKVKEILLKSEESLENKMQKYFKHSNVANLIQPSKQKRYKNKKTLVQLLCERPITTQSTKRSSTTASKEQSCVRPFSQPGILKKSQSLFMPSSPKKDNLFIKRANSTMLPTRRQVQKQRKSISPQANPKRNTFYEPKIKIVENQSKYPQLSRMRKMKQLQVKLQNDFEQRHGQFLDKIIKSKQLAYELRVGLDKIDELC